MAKDPAVLFYTSDFLTGTLTMENEQVGMYIKLLCLQHQKGRLSEKDMLKICFTYDKDVFSKFEKDEDGFFNKRLEDEIVRRKKYSESRSNNRKSKNKICKTYDKHMETVNETETVNEDKGSIPLFEDFKSYALENKPKVDLYALELKYKSWIENEWRDGNDKEIKNWKTKLLNTLPHIKENIDSLAGGKYEGMVF